MTIKMYMRERKKKELLNLEPLDVALVVILSLKLLPYFVEFAEFAEFRVLSPKISAAEANLHFLHNRSLSS